MTLKVFEDVYQTILTRKQDGDTQSSYVARLMSKGLDRILKKVGEEASEVIIAAKNSSEKEKVYEASDLLFHLMVLMAHQGITLDQIAEEFQRRLGVSGLEEKASRTSNS